LTQDEDGRKMSGGMMIKGKCMRTERERKRRRVKG